MIKDNHWRALRSGGQSLTTVCANARASGANVLHIEVEDAQQVREAIDAGATRLMIDNQPIDAFRTLAAIGRQLNAEIEIEATGGVTLANVRGYADAGADFVSVGALTHSVQALNMGLELEPT